MSLAELRGRGRRSSRLQPTASRAIGIVLAVLLHVVAVYALVNSLARHAVDVVRAPIETKIIDQITPEKQEPPPPPPQFSPPPPAFVPPPEIRIETPAPAQSTAITAITPVKPPPAPEPVRVNPKIDLKRSQEPAYPPASRRAGEQGSLILQVLIDADGRVEGSKLVQSSGFERLDQAALEGVKTSYRFIPGTVDGKPAQMWYTFKFTWKLQ